jgi:type VI secretion system (T6SS) phospholipase Tle1-like effector
MPNEAPKQKQPSTPDLRQSASLANVTTQGTAKATAITPGAPAKNTAVTSSLAGGQRVTFFFDGTGNNMVADYNANEKKAKHSNVAKLFRAHENNPAQGIYRHYLPGIGTLFFGINDTGGKAAAGTGGGGDDRLDWAMARLKEHFAKSKGAPVHVALFGFSRGAALARTFALRIADECEKGKDGIWRFSYQGKNYPIRLYFMGLFDTVASVGVAMSANNEPARGLTLGALTLKQALENRSGFSNALKNIAFGDSAGADPASGMANGHMSWGDDLHIPAMVEDCLHMVAAHELRNSFPLDSVLSGRLYPTNCREMIFPGAHSDVGGGYRPGEGARSEEPGSMLSLIPLMGMRAEARKAGVPLLKQIDSEIQKKDFAEDPASKSGYATLARRFNAYMKLAGWGSDSLGKGILSHMKLYYQWRFYRIARDQKLRASKLPTKDAAMLAKYESSWKQEKDDLEKQAKALKKETDEHTRNAMQFGEYALVPDMAKKAKEEAALAKQSRDKYLRADSLVSAQPSSDGSFVRDSELYDAQLLADARTLQAEFKKGRRNLRPHYRALLDAYEAEQQGRGLRDSEIIAFFDTYVHDSLAGFAGDATLPSDPRVIYIGSDTKLEYAMNKQRQESDPSSALG